jgi:hypothetical protein
MLCALQSIQIRRLPWVSPPSGILSELASRSEFRLAEVPLLLVKRSRFAVGPFTSAVRFSLSRLRWMLLNVQSNPLFEFRLPPEYDPAEPSLPVATGPLLSWAFFPFSTRGIKGPLDAGFAYPLRSAFRVCVPS